jgi:ADP-ribose pyrophosphatase YjhB (NUDIX family)
VNRLLPGPAEERSILRAFRRRFSATRWWEKRHKELSLCSRCGGVLKRRRVAAEGRTRWVCAACGFISYQNPKIVAATLPVRAGRVALLRRAIEPALGRWTMPAGYLEMGETVEAAARRETLEEIRVRVALTGPPQVYSYLNASVVTVVYPARVLSGSPRPGPEALEVRWFSPEEIPWRDLAFRSVYHPLKFWVETSSRER